MDILNDDVIRLIMSYLKYYDWMNFRLTCKRINDLVTNYDKLIRTRHYLQHIIKLNYKKTSRSGNCTCNRCGRRTDEYIICKYCRYFCCNDECFYLVFGRLNWNNRCDKCSQSVCLACTEKLGGPTVLSTHVCPGFF